MPGSHTSPLHDINLPEEALKAMEELGDKGGLVWIVAEHFQNAVKSLVPEFYNQKPNDSLGHWWRRVGEYLGQVENISGELFQKEISEDETTLSLSTATEIGRALKAYLLQLLEDGQNEKELPSWGSLLQEIYDPPLYEISQIVTFAQK